MNSVYISICSHELQGLVMREGRIVTAHRITYPKMEFLDVESLSRHMRALSIKLEQNSPSITNITLFLHGSFPHTIHMQSTPIKLKDEIEIGSYNVCHLNNKTYDINLDIYNQLPHTYMTVSISGHLLDCIRRAFAKQYITIDHIRFLPLQVIQNQNNSALAYLYEGKLMLATKSDNTINIKTLDIDLSPIGKLSFTFETASQVAEIRHSINQIINFISVVLQPYSLKFNIQFSGLFVNIPDLIAYVKYYAGDQHTYKWLDTSHENEIDENILYYSSLIQAACNF